MFVLSVMCILMVVLISSVCFSIIMFLISSIIKVKNRFSKTNRNNGSRSNNQKHKNNKDSKKEFTSKEKRAKKYPSFYSSRDQVPNFYTVKFYWAKDSTWYMFTIKKDGELEYYFLEDDGTEGSVAFGKNNVIKYFLHHFMMEYVNGGTISLPSNYQEWLIFITSDLYITEDYNNSTIKKVFNLFDKIHRHNRQNKNEYEKPEYDMKDVFIYFNVSHTASYEEIKISYKRMAREYHPDRGGSLEKMTELNVMFDKIKKHFGK